MPDTAENTIQSLARGLPAELKGAVQSVPIAELIYAIGRKHGLTIDKIGNLAQEIAWFISGKVRSQNFIPDLLLFLDADHGKVAAVAAEVNDKIFTPIRDALRRATILPPTPLAKPPPSTPPPPRPAPASPAVRPMPPAPPPPPPKPTRPLEAPIIRPLGVMPTEGTREQALGARGRRPMVEEIKPSVPPHPPPVITKAELERELERFRKPREVLGTRDQALADEAARPPIPPQEPPAQVKLPQQKLPKPPAPEKYTIDPYKEQVD